MRLTLARRALLGTFAATALALSAPPRMPRGASGRSSPSPSS
ncbi:hypothetical protein [Paenacidovorax monticola]